MVLSFAWCGLIATTAVAQPAPRRLRLPHDLAYAAIRWLRGNAETYGIDPDGIGLIGSSAGGHLVAMLGTSGRVEAVEGSLGDFRGLSSRMTCVVDFFGPANLLTMGDWGEHVEVSAEPITAQPRRARR